MVNSINFDDVFWKVKSIWVLTRTRGKILQLTKCPHAFSFPTVYIFSVAIPNDYQYFQFNLAEKSHWRKLERSRSEELDYNNWVKINSNSFLSLLILN